MAFMPIHPEWVKFPQVPVMGVRPKRPGYWGTSNVYTGGTGLSYVAATEKPRPELVRQGSMMRTPSGLALGADSPAAKKAVLLQSRSQPLLPTRGFAKRSRLRRHAQLTLLPSDELPFYDVTKVPSYISEVDTIGRAPKKPRPTRVWRGRDSYGMMKRRF